MSPGMKLIELKKQYEKTWLYPPPQTATKIKYVACNKQRRSDGKGVHVNKACWISPGVTSDIRYGPCWDYPPDRYKRFPLPPPCRGATLPAYGLIPKFDHCKSHYTRYDFTLEQCVHEQILIVEKQLCNLECQLIGAKEVQIMLGKEMRYHSIRRRLMIESACGIKIYPEYLSQIAEHQSSCDFQKAYNYINESKYLLYIYVFFKNIFLFFLFRSAELTASLVVIRDSISELRVRLDKLDKTLESPFLLILETVLPTIRDLYKYYFEVIRKFKTWAQLIDAGQEHSIEDYIALLRIDIGFEGFKSAGTEHCTCMRCRNENHLDTYFPCWCQGCDRRIKHVELMDNDFPCFVNINPQLKSSDTGFEPETSITSLLQIDEPSERSTV